MSAYIRNAQKPEKGVSLKYGMSQHGMTGHLNPNRPIPAFPLVSKSCLNGLLVLSLIPAALAVLFKLLNKLAFACNGEELTPTNAASPPVPPECIACPACKILFKFLRVSVGDIEFVSPLVVGGKPFVCCPGSCFRALDCKSVPGVCCADGFSTIVLALPTG